MLNKLFLPSIFAVLTYGFWISPEFKTISAGVAIFLFGMIALEQGFHTFSGGTLHNLLHKSTDTLPKSLAFGIVSTTIMQSSTMVSIVTLSFLSAGMLGLSAGIGIIFGANLGTTTGAWLIAGFGLKVNVSAYAMPMLVFGLVLYLQTSKTLKGIGTVLAALGFLFLGIHYIKEGFDTFKDTIDLSEFAMTGYAGVLVYTLIGIIATVIMQSSHTTMVLIITALSIGQINYENALAVAIGANIGTTVTAIIGAMGANADGKRLACAHLLFNAMTGIVAIATIYQMIPLVDGISYAFGIAEDNYTMKLAVFHTVFNLLGVIIMTPFIQNLVNLLERVVPSDVIAQEEPKYLTDAAKQFPDTAVRAVHNETVRLYRTATRVIAEGLGLTAQELGDEDIELTLKNRSIPSELDIDNEYEKNIKSIFSAIIQFIAQSDVTTANDSTGRFHWLRDANKQIVDAVKDIKHLHKNMSIYLKSGNHHIRDGYNLIRVQIAETLRELKNVYKNEDNDLKVLLLDNIKLKVKQRDQELNQMIDFYIRNNNITPRMGTSLINDSAYAYNICDKLIKTGESLFVNPQDPEAACAIRGMALTDRELNNIVSSQVNAPDKS